VTIATATWDTRAAVAASVGSLDENNNPRYAQEYARVASTERQEYINAGGTEPVGKQRITTFGGSMLAQVVQAGMEPVIATN